jgi:H+/Cl- antiporter ClcA
MQLDPADINVDADNKVDETAKKGLFARAQKSFERTRPNLGIASEGQFLLLSAAVGVLTGTTVTLFKLAIGLLKKHLYGDFVGIFPINISQLVVLLIPLLGALGVVLVKNLVPKRDFGPGIGGLIEEVDRQVPFDIRRALGKSLAAIATLGTGNSLGPEGPAVGKISLQ